jgi:hypothetical protein
LREFISGKEASGLPYSFMGKYQTSVKKAVPS